MDGTTLRFRITDLMILAIAAAVGCIFSRYLYQFTYFEWYKSTLDSAPMPGKIAILFRLTAHFCSPFVLLLTLTILGLHAARIGPNVRELMRSPGSTSCVVVALFLAVAIAVRLACLKVGWEHKDGIAGNYYDTHAFVQSALRETFTNSPPGVLSIWAVVAVSGRWTTQPNWIDRVERVTGCYWVLLNLMPR
jgi:hypothetical protein